MKKIEPMYIFSNGRVAAISKKDGNIIWEVKIKDFVKSSGYTYAIGQMSVEKDKLYVGVSGILVCLSTKDGSLIWKNELKGWGYSFVSMSNVNSSDAAAMAVAAAVATSIAT